MQWVRSAPISVLALLALGACSSSNTSEAPTLDSQAIDGFIVGGAVFCDGDEAGETSAGGHLSCPANTVLVTVRGGMDVGFDASATASDMPFTGELRAPADLGFVTPLSTVAVQMASTETGYDAQLWDEKVAQLAAALGDPTLDLAADSSKDMQLIRFNAQLQQVLSSFARSEAEYGQAIEALATVITARAAVGATIDLENDVTGTMTAINAALLNKFSPLAQSASKLEASTLAVQSANLAIAEASSPGLVAASAVGATVARAVVTIDRSAQSVFLGSYNDAQYAEISISIDDFEDSTLSNGSYQTQVGKGLAEVGYSNEVLKFSQDMDNVQVTMGFELKSTVAGDPRRLSFYSDDIRLSATANRPDSLVITLPDGATFHAIGTDTLGTITSAEVLIDDKDTFSNRDEYFSVNYDSVMDKLESLGFEDIFESSGNYEMTLIIGGIQLKERSGLDVVPATRYAITVGSRQVSGAGFKGYMSYLN